MAKDKVTGRPQGAPNPLEPARQTTIINPQAPAGTAGTGGPPSQGLAALLTTVLGLDFRTFWLVNPLTDAQARSAAADYFPEALKYLRATGQMMTRNAGHFGRLNYTGADLDSRSDRVELISELVTRLGGFLGLLKDTLLVEMSDAVKMSDTAVEQIELESKMPGLSPGERQNLNNMSAVPMGIWKQRVAGIQQTRGAGQRDRSATQDTVDQAMASAVAERVLGQIQSGQRPSDQDILFALSYLGQQQTDQAPPPATTTTTPKKKPAKTPKSKTTATGTTAAAGASSRRSTKR